MSFQNQYSAAISTSCLIYQARTSADLTGSPVSSQVKENAQVPMNVLQPALSLESGAKVVQFEVQEGEHEDPDTGRGKDGSKPSPKTLAAALACRASGAGLQDADVEAQTPSLQPEECTQGSFCQRLCISIKVGLGQYQPNFVLSTSYSLFHCVIVYEVQRLYASQVVVMNWLQIISFCLSQPLD